MKSTKTQNASQEPQELPLTQYKTMSRSPRSDPVLEKGHVQLPSEATLRRTNDRKNKLLKNGGSDILTGVLRPGGRIGPLTSQSSLLADEIIHQNIDKLRRKIESGNKDYLPFRYSADSFWEEKIPLLRKWCNNQIADPASVGQSYQEAKPHLKEFAVRMASLHSDHRIFLLNMTEQYLCETNGSTHEKVNILFGILFAYNELSKKINKIRLSGWSRNDANTDIEQDGMEQLSQLLQQKSNLSLLVSNLSNITSAEHRKPVIDFFAEYMQSNEVPSEDHEDFLLMLLGREDCLVLSKTESNRLQSLVFEDGNVQFLLDRFASQGDLEGEMLTLLDMAVDYFDRDDVSLKSKRTVMAHFIDDTINLAEGGSALSDVEHEIIGRVDALIVKCVSFMEKDVLEYIAQHRHVLPLSCRLSYASLPAGGGESPDGPAMHDNSGTPAEAISTGEMDGALIETSHRMRRDRSGSDQESPSPRKEQRQ